MKNLIVIVLIILFITLFVIGLDKITSGAGQNSILDAMDKMDEDAKLPTRLWIAKLDLSGATEIVAVYRQGNATHIIKTKSMHAMSWVDDPESQLTRNTIYFSGGQLENTLHYTEYMAAEKLAKEQIASGTLPTVIDIRNEIFGEDKSKR